MPAVESVIRFGESPIPAGSVNIRVALITLGRFNSGSPIPIITMFSRSVSARNLVRPHHEQHLPHNLARRQISLQPHQRGQAELAIHRATHLARNANGVARPSSGIRTVSTVRPSSSFSR